MNEHSIELRLNEEFRISPGDAEGERRVGVVAEAVRKAYSQVIEQLGAQTTVWIRRAPSVVAEREFESDDIVVRVRARILVARNSVSTGVHNLSLGEAK